MADYTYRDFDFSFDKTVYNDIPVVTDGNDIRTTLYNNLFISSQERWFDNSNKPNIRDVIHQPDNFVTRKMLTDIITEVAYLDPRIRKILSINIQGSDYTYDVFMKIQTDMTQRDKEELDVNLIISKE